MTFSIDAKISILLPCANVGGTEISWLEHAIALRERGFAVRFVSLHPDGGFARVLASMGFEIEEAGYKGPFGILSTGRLLGILHRHDPSVVICVTPSLPMIVACLVGRFRAICSMDTHHGGGRLPLRWPLIYRLCGLACSHVVCPTDFLRNEVVSFHRGLAPRTVVVPYRLDSPTVAGETSNENGESHYGNDQTHLRVGFIGQLIARKRPDLFVEVAKSVMERRQDVSFHVAGAGALRKDMEDWVKAAGLTRSFTFLGSISNTRDFYRSMDAVFFSSEVDALGRVPFEALSQGTPVVGYLGRGGLTEYLPSGSRVCRLESSDNVATLTEDLLQMLESECGRAAQREECVKCFEDIKARSASSTALFDLMESLVGGA